MRRALLLSLFAFACSINHSGLLPPGVDDDAGPTPDVVIQDSDGADLDVTRVPDVFDGGPVLPLPMDCTVHVALGGSDDATGSMSEPLRTIGTALATDTPVICVAEGQFDEALRVTHDVRIRGGYCDGFMRRRCVTELRAPGDRVMQIRGPVGRLRVELEYLSLETGNASGPGGSTYGIQVIESELVIRNSSIRAKDGSAGADSAVGATGAAGENGGDGDRRSGGGACSQGGEGGNIIGGASPGEDGEGAGGGFGLGGTAGSGGDGNDGTDGEASRAVGAPGAGGNGNGAISAEAEFLARGGEPGDTGPPGGGGGGGGAGSFGIGNVGGGGGGGGCGGDGGAGGGGGGGSFGIVAIRSSVLFEGDVTVSLGRGGDGGQGGLGGGGQGGPAVAVLLGDSSLEGVPKVEGGEGGAGGGGGVNMGMPGALGARLLVDIRE